MHPRSVRAVAIGTLAQRAWQRPPGRLRLEAATFSGGIAVQGGGPENALQPRHARPLQEFLRNNARSALQRPPFPLRGGDIRRVDARGLRALRVLAPQLGSTLPPPPRRGAPRKRGSRIHGRSGPAGFTRFGGSPGDISRTKRAGEGVIGGGLQSERKTDDARVFDVRRPRKRRVMPFGHEENINTTFTIPYLTYYRPWSIFMTRRMQE